MTEEKQILCANDETFASTIIDSDLPVLVDFWAPWCGPCRAIAPTIEELAKEYAGKIKFVKVNIDQGLRTAISLDVMNVPTIIMFDRGKPMNRLVGSQPKAILSSTISQWLNQNAEPRAPGV